MGQDFWGLPIWDLDLLDYISSVKGTYKFGVLSDAWINTREKVQEWINYDLFDAIIFSCEVRVSKPDPSSYTNILSRLNVAAEECIFVDDRTVNVECVRRIGRKAMQYNGDMDIRAAVEQLTTKGRTWRIPYGNENLS